jgi:hypothetical protein
MLMMFFQHATEHARNNNVQSSGNRQRPYRDECTGSLSNSEVNRRRAWSVLGWVTAWEALWVLLAFCGRRKLK